ncbi:hypothetical protein [Bartonella tamiae]|uniref:Uncharacterized protein n=1 Tax=Bartonella tamiae Th239 TaxID=1094558 RepID=J0QZI9_9HYPH|nr:hypothetical protein [Bartonella tamiae]EJF91566.1 hypothetical protein ME5_00261 [Bartonella tamiae Th239]EJF92450.1 hypothetical protein MEG_01620 [Bartonella tamiae Th307]
MPFFCLPSGKSRVIAIFAFDDSQILDITGPLQVFATANDFCHPNNPAYTLHILARSTSIKTTSGLVLNCLKIENAPKKLIQ